MLVDNCPTLYNRFTIAEIVRIRWILEVEYANFPFSLCDNGCLGR